MESLLSLAATRPSRTLHAGETLIVQGEPGGDLYILESGQLTVQRDGIDIATISTPNALVGEMSVVLGTPNSATVRADGTTVVRVIQDARAVLEQDPALTFRLAWLMATRLNATSAYLVDLTKQQKSASDRGLLGKILSALHLPVEDQNYVALSRSDLFGGSESAGKD